MFGQFEASSEIGRTALGRVWRASGPGSKDANFAVKLLDCGVLSFVADDSAVTQRLDAFAEAASVQARAASIPDSGWAPVHATGRGEDSAYLVTDLLPLNVARLVEGRAAARGHVLVTVITGIVHALKSIRGAQGRGHGNLRPTNVFFDRAGDLPQSRIVLTDPRPSSELDADRGEVADLRAIGQIIHQLVTHEQFEALGGWPVPPGPAWSRLGKIGDGWRDLCSDLLDPDLKPGAMTLDRLAERAVALTPPPRPVLRYVALAVGVVAIFVGAWMAWDNRPWKPLDWDDSLWSEVCDNSDWYAALIEGTLVGEVDERAKRFEAKLQGGEQRRKLLGDDLAALAGDPALADRVEAFVLGFGSGEMDQAAWDRFAAMYPEVALPDSQRALSEYVDERTRPTWMLGHSRRFAPAVKKSWTTESKEVFRTERPAVSGGALTQAAYGLRIARFMQRELQTIVEAHQASLRESVETLVANGPPAPKAGDQVQADVEQGSLWLESTERIPDRVRALADAGRNAAQLADSWKSIQEGLATIAPTDAASGPQQDAVAHGLLDSVRAGVTRADDAGGLEPVLDTLQAWESAISAIAPVIASSRAEIDWEVLETRDGAVEIYASARTGSLNPSMLGAWSELVRDQSYWLATDARPALGLGPDLAGAAQAIEAIEPVERVFYAQELAALDDRAAKARDDAVAVESLRWIRRNRDPILAEVARLQQDARTLRQDAQGLVVAIAASAEEQSKRWATEDPASLTSIVAIQQHWNRERERIASRVGPATGGTHSQLRAVLRNLRGVLFHEEDIRTGEVRAEGWSGSIQKWGSTPIERPEAWDQHAWERALQDQRERLAARLLASIQGWEADEPLARWAGSDEAESTIREAWASADAWLERSAALARDLRRVERLRDEWHASDESPADGGETIAQTLARWRAEPDFALAMQAGAAVLADADRLASTREAPRAELITLASADATNPWLRFAAWRSLGQTRLSPVWPASAEELGLEIQSRASVIGDVPGIPDDVRRAALLAEVDRAGPPRWSHALVAGGPDQLKAIMDRRADLGVTGDAPGLTPEAAINLAMFEFATTVRRVDDEERVKAMGAALVARVRPLLSSIEPSVATTIAPSIQGIDEIAGGRDTRKTLQDILAENGPGINGGWRVIATEGTGPDGQAAPEIIRYEGPNAHRLTFVRADVDDPEPVYVATEEVSIGLVQAIATSAQGGLSRFRAWSKLEALEDRRGIFTWRLQGKRIAPWIPSTGWWNDSNISAADSFPAGMEPPPPPTPETPINWIEPEAAEQVAAVVGCRLPTSAEWRLALAKERTLASDGPGANLRDPTFTRFTEHVATLRQAQPLLVFPHAKGAYDPGDIEHAPAASATTTEDGSIWFEPQSHPNRGQTFRHLLGNVGEFVDDAPGERGGYGVVGGSAMSISSDPDATKPIRTRAAFSDVGFRLVFQAKDLKPAMWAAMLKEFGPAPPYIFDSPTQGQ